MTRDDVRKTFPEATDEQVKAIMDLHGADIERTKGAAGADAVLVGETLMKSGDIKAELAALRASV